MFEQLEFNFETTALETRNDRWAKSEVRNCNVCGKDYLLYTMGPQTKAQEAGPNFCCTECWKLGFILINRGAPLFHKLCEVNEISMEDVARAETEAARRDFPYLHRRNNLVK